METSSIIITHAIITHANQETKSNSINNDYYAYWPITSIITIYCHNNSEQCLVMTLKDLLYPTLKNMQSIINIMHNIVGIINNNRNKDLFVPPTHHFCY